MVRSIPFPRPYSCPPTEPSIQDVLKHFIPPIKTGDDRVDFYKMYKKESAEYDTEFVKKYDEDLNTTLIFVRCPPSYLANHLIDPCRLVCSLLSAPPLSSTSSRISGTFPTNKPVPSSLQSSSLKTHPPFPARSSPFRKLRKGVQRGGSSPQPA